MARKGVQTDLASAAEAFSALGDPFRLTAFRAVAGKGARGVLSSELSRELGAPSPRVAGALRALRRAGVLTSRIDGRKTRYVVSPSFAKTLAAVRPPG